ncbi:MAG: hypothetical protein Q7J25_13870, partial [Vicinamibacterales bacterium]|nr:hypothetical protein [Vicinamibacterales bacterium]
HLGQQVESLSAKVDFSDRRVRAIEGGAHQSEVRTAAAAPPPPRQDLSRQDVPGGAPAGGSSDQAQGDGARRKRRRRRGRRPGGPDMPSDMQPGLPGARMLPSATGDGDDGVAYDGGTDDGGTDDGTGDSRDDRPDETGPGGDTGGAPIRVEAERPPVVDVQPASEPGTAPSGTPEER